MILKFIWFRFFSTLVLSRPNHPIRYSSINFQKPSPEEIFKIILLAPEAYEEKHPLKNIKEKTIRDCTIESVTCDDNGAYYKSNRNKRMFYVETMQHNLTAKLIHIKNAV